MTGTTLAVLIAAAFAFAGAAPQAKAASLDASAGALKQGAAWSTLRHDAHGCHYSCDCGPLKDFGCERVYHRHLHMLCRPVRCDREKDCGRAPSEGLCRHLPPP